MMNKKDKTLKNIHFSFFEISGKVYYDFNQISSIKIVGNRIVKILT